MPREMVMVRMACAICEFATSQMPSAIWMAPKPSWPPSSSSAWTAASRSRLILPPAKFFASTRPSTKFASVTVGSVPPRP